MTAHVTSVVYNDLWSHTVACTCGWHTTVDTQGRAQFLAEGHERYTKESA